MRRASSFLTPAALAALLALAGCGESRPVAGQSSDAQCSGCHVSASAAEIGSGAHAAHVRAATIAGAMGCGECHRVPAALAAPGHMDGKVDVAFSAKAGGARARWSGEQRSCAVYCHGEATPVWTQVDGSHSRCGACHGIPPGGSHPQVESRSEVCATCHPSTVRPDGRINLAGGAHVNGRVDRGGDAGIACGSCHGIPPGGGHTSSTTCGSCHQGYTATSVNPALHQNGRKDVTAQACGSCHAIPPSTGQHREHVEEGISCGRCHEGASASAGGPGHMNGVVNVSAPGWNAGARSCANSCHGTERWDGGGGGDDD